MIDYYYIFNINHRFMIRTWLMIIHRNFSLDFDFHTFDKLGEQFNNGTRANRIQIMKLMKLSNYRNLNS